MAKKASRPEVMGVLGGFAGPVLVSKATTRSRCSQRPTTVSAPSWPSRRRGQARHGRPRPVAMVVDDLVVCGAEPLFRRDYIAVGASCRAGGGDRRRHRRGLHPGRLRAARGETAEHPGVMADGDYDISATGVGVVEADQVLGPTGSVRRDVVWNGASGLALQRILAGPQVRCRDRPDCR
ncbi:hypothetical protein GS421_00550 [Rhodococcus hoagii]|nr:hypothetical protein [Prescottella equi]